jgi:serine protease inhibitor ecotin
MKVILAALLVIGLVLAIGYSVSQATRVEEYAQRVEAVEVQIVQLQKQAPDQQAFSQRCLQVRQTAQTELPSDLRLTHLQMEKCATVDEKIQWAIEVAVSASSSLEQQRYGR